MNNSGALKLADILRESFQQYQLESNDPDLDDDMDEKEVIAFIDNHLYKMDFDEIANDFISGAYDYDFPPDLIKDANVLKQKLKKGAEIILSSANGDLDIDNNFDNLFKFNKYLASEFIKLFPYTSNKEHIDFIYDALYNAIKNVI